MKRIAFLFIAFLALSFSYAQDCKVKMKSISQTYLGNCKKGLADGKGEAKGIDCYAGEFKNGYPDGEGIYTWENGDVYKGNFKNGKKQGQGTFISKNDEQKLNGFWGDDKYIGLYENPFKKIDKSPNVSSYSLKRTNDEGIQGIRFYIRENQTNMYDPDLNIIVHNGSYGNVVNTKSYFELAKVSFPFKAKAYYKQEYVEFEILEPGLWDIQINITTIDGLGPK